jgi:hypothetical protein
MTERKKGIKEKAVLVRLIFRNGVRFTITDKPVTQEVEERHQTSKTGRYVKVLFKREAIQAIFDAENIAKNAHSRYTLPWFDSGIRILPVAMFDKYNAALNKAKEEYDKAITKFINGYDEIMEENKARLKEMFNAEDYPSKESAVMGFRLSASYFPIPDKDDFRIDASEAIVEGFKDQYEKDMKSYEMNAKSDVANRLNDSMSKLILKLSSADKKITDGALLKLSELLKDLKGLNVTGDTEINKAIKEVETNFAKETAEAFNVNPEYRAKKKAEAVAIVGRLETSFPRAIEF